MIVEVTGPGSPGAPARAGRRPPGAPPGGRGLRRRAGRDLPQALVSTSREEPAGRRAAVRTGIGGGKRGGPGLRTLSGDRNR